MKDKKNISKALITVCKAIQAKLRRENFHSAPQALFSFRLKMSCFVTLCAVAGLTICCVALRPAAYGQVVTASLQGLVRDPNGNPVRAAKVMTLDVSTGVTTRTVTNAKGLFAFPNLNVGGPYTVTVTAPGFKTSCSGRYRGAEYISGRRDSRRTDSA